eukprot:scpid76541/ scgid26933/ 
MKDTYIFALLFVYRLHIQPTMKDTCIFARLEQILPQVFLVHSAESCCHCSNGHFCTSRCNTVVIHDIQCFQNPLQCLMHSLKVQGKEKQNRTYHWYHDL